MPKQQIVFHQSPMERRRFLLDPDECSSRNSHRLAEVAGGTTAECAAVVCCFPCTVVNFIVLAVYKVPAGLCRKALRKNKRRMLMKKGLLIHSPRGGVGDVSGGGYRIDAATTAVVSGERFVMNSGDEFIELENEMWEKFYGTGFWRSLSQRID
uniref:uncharacterized protein LOC122606010 n=1 Tax=Erigeron canadensis TaxID=72917 RepID=UPI001CB9AD57|nr:uncharacterized protein LOC122606010 [Erigeron canadensis]